MVKESNNTLGFQEPESKEIKFEIINNIATLKSDNKDGTLKVLLADRDKIVKFLDLPINPEDSNYRKLDKYQDMSMWHEIIDKLKKAFFDVFIINDKKIILFK